MKKMLFTLVLITYIFIAQAVSAGELTREVYENEEFGVGIAFPPEYSGKYTVNIHDGVLDVLHTATAELMMEEYGYYDGRLFSLHRVPLDSTGDGYMGVPLFETSEYAYYLWEPTGVEYFTEDMEHPATVEYLTLDIYDASMRNAFIDNIYPVGADALWRTYFIKDKVRFTYPANWTALEYQNEDGFGFSTPFNDEGTAGFSLSVGADWHVEGKDGYLTEDEFTNIYSKYREDFKITGIEKIQIGGLEAQKVTFTNTIEGIEYTQVICDVIAGVASYRFVIAYYTLASDYYGGMIDKIIDSVYFYKPDITYTETRTGMTVLIPTSMRNKYGIELLARDWEDKAGFRIYNDTDGTLITFIAWLGEYTDAEPPVLDGVPQTILFSRNGYIYTYSIPESLVSSDIYEKYAEQLRLIKLNFRITDLSAAITEVNGRVYENVELGVGIVFPPEYEGKIAIVENENYISVIHLATKQLMEEKNPFSAVNDYGELFWVTRYEFLPDEDANQIKRESGAYLFETHEWIYVLRTPSGPTHDYEHPGEPTTQEFNILYDYETMIQQIIDSVYPVGIPVVTIVPLVLEYDAVSYFNCGLAVASKYGRYGYIDETGSAAIPFEFDWAGEFRNGYARIMKADKYGLIDAAGKIVIPAEYDWIGNYEEGLVAVNKNSARGFLDGNGEVVVPLSEEYESANYIGEGLFMIKRQADYLCVLLDNTGKIIMETEYSWIDSFYDGLVTVKKDGEWGYMDTEGNEVIPPSYRYASNFYGGLAQVHPNDPINSCFINKSGEVAFTTDPEHWDYTGWGFFDGRLLTGDGESCGFYGEDGEIVIPLIYEEANYFNEGLAAVKKDGKWGFININGETIIPFEFDSVNSFKEGFACVEKDSKWGYIDKNGAVVIPLSYDCAWDFNEGLAFVYKDGKFGILRINSFYVH